MSAPSIDDLPRERLLNHGASTLNDAELVALMIGSARTPPDQALALAEQLLDDLDGPAGLARATIATLLRAKGIGPVRAARLRACFELQRRIGPIEEPVDPEAAHVERLRGQVPTGERAILGFRPDAPDQTPATLDLGADLGPTTRYGSVLARLLNLAPDARWWIVAIRPRGRVAKTEREAAQRLASAAELLGLELDRVLLVAGDEAIDLVAR